MNAFFKKHETPYRMIVFFMIMAVYAAEIAILSTHIETVMAAPWYWWASTAFAVLMTARTVTFYGVMDWFRWPFVTLEKDSSHAGSNPEPRPGIASPFGWLLCCPICTGTHAASALVLLYSLAPSFGLAASICLGFAGLSSLLQYTAEYVSWGARKNRVMAGLISPDPGTEGYAVREKIYTTIQGQKANINENLAVQFFASLMK